MIIELLRYSVVAFFVFLIIDFVWLGVIAKKFYKKELGLIIKDKSNLLAAFVFYVIYATAIAYFIVMPALIADLQLILRVFKRCVFRACDL